MICRYCHQEIETFEKITSVNPSGLKRVFHVNCFFLCLGFTKKQVISFFVLSEKHDK